MSRLEQLADLMERGALTDGDRRDIAALLRAASAETVGTEWSNHPDGKLMCNAFADASHNREIHAARLAIADLKAERDAALASLAERQRAIDEAFAVLDAGHGMLACREAAHILRPHATKATGANTSATLAGSTARRWRREYYHDRSFWVNWRVSKSRPERQCDLYKKEGPSDTFEGFTRLDDDTWCLEWQEGDTADNLPPLPTEATPATTQPTAGVTPVGSGTTPQASPVGNDDTRELVARLAEAIARYFDDGEETVINLINRVRDIENAARRGGGA